MAKKKGTQPSLEGMEDRQIKELQDAAVSYAEIRDVRQEQGKLETTQTLATNL
jgi:hypothetical protein